MRSATPNFYALSREGSNLELNWIGKLLAVGQGTINNSNEAITVKKGGLYWIYRQRDKQKDIQYPQNIVLSTGFGLRSGFGPTNLA